MVTEKYRKKKLLDVCRRILIGWTETETVSSPKTRSAEWRTECETAKDAAARQVDQAKGDPVALQEVDLAVVEVALRDSSIDFSSLTPTETAVSPGRSLPRWPRALAVAVLAARGVPKVATISAAVLSAPAATISSKAVVKNEATHFARPAPNRPGNFCAPLRTKGDRCIFLSYVQKGTGAFSGQLAG
jgi:hypothetical protein